MTDTPVTQADKELYCEISGHPKGSEITEQVMAGTAYTWEVQQIANHRAQSEPSGDASQDELCILREELSRMARDFAYFGFGRGQSNANKALRRLDTILAKQERGE